MSKDSKDKDDKDKEAVTVVEEKPHLVRMQAHEDCTSISVAGHQFDVPATGIVDCPPHVAAELASHGFTPYVEKKGRARASV